MTPNYALDNQKSNYNLILTWPGISEACVENRYIFPLYLGIWFHILRPKSLIETPPKFEMQDYHQGPGLRLTVGCSCSHKLIVVKLSYEY